MILNEGAVSATARTDLLHFVDKLLGSVNGVAVSVSK